MSCFYEATLCNVLLMLPYWSLIIVCIGHHKMCGEFICSFCYEWLISELKKKPLCSFCIILSVFWVFSIVLPIFCCDLMSEIVFTVICLVYICCKILIWNLWVFPCSCWLKCNLNEYFSCFPNLFFIVICIYWNLINTFCMPRGR